MRSLGETAFGIAHDVNNILAAVRLRVGIILKDPACVAAQGPNLQSIDRILREGAALLARLQNFGRTEPAPIEAVDLADTVRRAVEIAQSGLRRRALETGVDVRIRCLLDGLPPVRGIAEDLRHVFVNLLINARDAMPRGGTITVRGRPELDGVLVLVEDEGTGIPPELLPRIFEAFFTTKGERGTGMGLAIARRLMERIGGSISAHNRDEGGACFALRFLVHPAEATRLAEPEVEPEPQRRPPVRASGLRQPHA